MDKNTLLIFAQRICSSSSSIKARKSLNQLKMLLQEQGEGAESIDLLDRILVGIPEIQTMARQKMLTESDVLIAERRAKERLAREEEARRHGRC